VLIKEIDMADYITIGGWRAIPNPNGGYDIHSNSTYDSFKGWARTKEAAIRWLEDSSGVTYSRLPELRKGNITMVPGGRQSIPKFPFRKRDYYEHTHYYNGEFRLGSILTKYTNGKCSYMTLPVGSNSCIPYPSLRWLCEANGFRLID
jgi:hypothetical protein